MLCTTCDVVLRGVASCARGTLGGVRQVGLMAHGGFAEWYVQFIAHFIAVYEV